MSNRLTRIYTGKGDDGTTGLANNTRVEKDSLRIAAIGEIDELNCLLGILNASYVPDDIAGYVLNIQHRLFDIGGELAVPGDAVIEEEHIKRLEDLIKNYNEDLKPLREFILPGGNMAASLCHLARSVCRRAERSIVRLGHAEALNPNTLAYINRLSDLLFVFSRVLNQGKGGKEIYWDKNRLKNSV